MVLVVVYFLKQLHTERSNKRQIWAASVACINLLIEAFFTQQRRGRIFDATEAGWRIEH